MAEVRVTEAHSLSRDEAKAKIDDFEQMMSKYGVKAKWKGHHADLKGMGVSGTIDITDRDAQIVVKLGMMAKAAGVDPKRLEGSIRKRIRAAFGGDEA
jgi:putative polyhydroxyalkanoate system protein